MVRRIRTSSDDRVDQNVDSIVSPANAERAESPQAASDETEIDQSFVSAVETLNEDENAAAVGMLQLKAGVDKTTDVGEGEQPAAEGLLELKAGADKTIIVRGERSSTLNSGETIGRSGDEAVKAVWDASSPPTSSPGDDNRDQTNTLKVAGEDDPFAHQLKQLLNLRRSGVRVDLPWTKHVDMFRAAGGINREIDNTDEKYEIALLTIWCHNRITGHERKFWAGTVPVCLDSPLSTLSETVRSFMKGIRDYYVIRELMKDLGKQRKGFKMEAYIFMGFANSDDQDERDDYINTWTDHGSRFEDVSDFFRDDECYNPDREEPYPVMNASITIDEIEIDFSKLDCNGEMPKPEIYSYHGIGMDVTEFIRGKTVPGGIVPAVTFAYRFLASDYRRSRQLGIISGRPGNGTATVGCCDAWLAVDGNEQPRFWTTEYARHDSDIVRRLMVMNDIEILASSRKSTMVNVPRLPAMTYKDFWPDAVEQWEIPDGPIKLTVRLVNRLHFINRDGVPLPATMLLNVTSGLSQDKAIKAAILSGLNGLLISGDDDFVLHLARIFSPDICDLWDIEFWVMPQGEKMDKLYSYNGKKSLKWYLTPSLAGKGERALYMEAHFVRARVNNREVAFVAKEDGGWQVVEKGDDGWEKINKGDADGEGDE